MSIVVYCIVLYASVLAEIKNKYTVITIIGDGVVAYDIVVAIIPDVDPLIIIGIDLVVRYDIIA